MSSIGPKFIASVGDLLASVRASGVGASVDNTIEGGLQPLQRSQLGSGDSPALQTLDFDRMVRNATAFDDTPIPVFRHLGDDMLSNTF